MKPQRLTAIDTIRGIAVIGMVLAHTNAYFSGNYWARTLWDLSLFAVHVFIFCSAYLFFSQVKEKQPAYNWIYFKKRLSRLLIPYYVFLAVYCVLLILFKQPPTLNYIIKSITLTGGIDFNWLVLLFIYFTFLMPLLDILLKKKISFYVYAFLACSSAALLLFVKIPLHFKFFMWLPWSVVIISGWFATKVEHEKKSLLKQGFIWGIVFLITLATQYALDHSLRQYENKYPPNLYHISYGIAFTLVLYEVAKTSLFTKLRLQPFLDFLSTYSYSFYFLHVVVLHTFVRFIHPTNLGWPLFFVCILTLSTMCQYILNQSLKYLKKN